MDNILEIKNLNKQYTHSNFSLTDVTFSVPYGSIMGFIGENGAGKTSTINSILNIISPDSGTIKIMGKTLSDTSFELKENIGVVFDAPNFSHSLTPRKLNNVMKLLYHQWDSQQYFSYISLFNLPINKQIKTFSKGMTMKLSLAVALSHKPKFLILDEATSGLDPIVREEILDIFLDFVGDSQHSILLSSHITSDLEKIADYLTFIHRGEIILTIKKDELLYNYGILRCKSTDLPKIDYHDIITYRKKDYQIDILIKNKNVLKRKYPHHIIDDVLIDEAMLLLVKGEKNVRFNSK